MCMKKVLSYWLKRISISLFVFCVTYTAMAQKYVTCTNCGGTGIGMVTMTGSMPCLLCFGKGKIIDAYNAGRALGLVTNGKLALVQGNYTTAKQAFYQAMDECEDGLATFFYGV